MKTERNELLNGLEGLYSKGYTYLVKIYAVDYVKTLEAVYVVRNMEEAKEERLEVELDPSDAWVPSAMRVYKAADWYEREMQEMFAITIKGRQAERLLLEKWNGSGAPLRKNFAWSEPYEKMK